MTPERYQRMVEVLNRRQKDLTVVMERVHKAHNFSALLRSCDAAGVFEAHAVLPRVAVDISPLISGGTGKWVRVRVHRTITGALAHLAEQGLRIVAAHPGPEALDFREVDFTRPTAIVLGTEKFGVTERGREGADALVSIPMQGMGVSLNVSVAGALMLYEAERQRARAGMYDVPRLDARTRRKTLFEWGYPELAAQCRRQGRPYPELDREGGLLSEL